MNYANIKYNDIANGIGVRTSLFVSGCRHHCPGCFNEEAWSFQAGKPFTDSVMVDIMHSCQPDQISGVSILGGEPFEPENQSALIRFLQFFRLMLPKKSVWCWSGFTFEQLIGVETARCYTQHTLDLLQLIDVLVDGPFIQDQKNISLQFRGSSNQRILDLHKSLPVCEPIWWDGLREGH